MSRKTTIIILSGLIILLVIVAAYRLGNSNSRIKELNNQLYFVKDSLEDIGAHFNELHAEYLDLQQELDRTKSKLYMIKAELDTMTSRRMSTYTEVHARLIELKLKLGKVEIYKNDSSQFRFK